MKLTVIDLAKKAGVSIATISRALNPETRHKVAPETLRIIEKLAAKHNYTPNKAAKHLRKSAYKTIGVLFPHHQGMLTSEYYMQILSGAADAVLNSDYQLKMILLKPEQAPWDHYDFKNGEGVDGLIVTYWRSFFKRAEVFKKIGVPCVVINNCESNIRARFFAGDHYQGSRLAAQHLIENGHKNIAILKGKYESPDICERLQGFQDEVKKSLKTTHNTKVIESSGYAEEDAYAVADQILDAKPPFTAAFCVNDTLALGILKRMEEKGLSCPENLSIVGYDNDRGTTHSHPPLSTINVPVYELSKLATQDLIYFLKNPTQKSFLQTRRLPAQLIQRSSVAHV